VPPRVLVVEDNPVNLELLTALLEEAGCQVLSAESAAAGLQLAAAERPVLILMDIQLPDMTGYEVTRWLKADPATAAIPVVAITAQAMRGDDAKARGAGCDAYLTKPLETQTFREILRRFIGIPRSEGDGDHGTRG
jgi:two-component system, cell cycle response regulator DivK